MPAPASAAMSRPVLYDLDATAILTGYSATSLETFASHPERFPFLVRGVHYVVRRFQYGTRTRRIRLFTVAGIEALRFRHEKGRHGAGRDLVAA